MRKIILSVFYILIVFLSVGIVIWTNTKFENSIQYQKGYSAALDIFQKILIEKNKSDTSVLKLVIVNPDTFTCYLSSKYKRN